MMQYGEPIQTLFLHRGNLHGTIPPGFRLSFCCGCLVLVRETDNIQHSPLMVITTQGTFPVVLGYCEGHA